MQVLNAADYGVPQNRKRAVFVGFKDDYSFEFPLPFSTSKITAYEALSDLSEEGVPDGSEYSSPASCMYQKYARKNSNGIYNHEIPGESHIPLELRDVKLDYVRKCYEYVFNLK